MLHRLKAAPKSVWTLNPDAGRLPAIVMVSSVNIPITEETPAQHNGHGADDFVHQSVARHGGGTVESESIQGGPKCVDVIISGGQVSHKYPTYCFLVLIRIFSLENNISIIYKYICLCISEQRNPNTKTLFCNGENRVDCAIVPALS